jgi:AraC family transcriptional regulator of adaptative response / DNA-3-methyladenine glycosylase II
MDLTDTRRYRAVVARDRRFDGRFFVGVRTTGIFCRPICPAPTPHAGNIEFFAHAAAAIAAGYRPCLRCHPEAAPGTPAWEGSPALVRRALGLIAEGGLNDDDVEAFAERLGVGARHLRRLFDAHVGASPAAVARTSRLSFARRLLDETDLRITDIAFASGFRSVRQFNYLMRATFQAAPRALRARRGDGPARAGIVLRLPYRPPLDWDALLAFLAARATPGVEVVEHGVYQRAIVADGATGLIAVEHEPARSRLRLTVHLPGPLALRDVVARVRRLFDLDADPLAIARQLGRHPTLSALVNRRPGLRVPGAWDGFEAAARAIVGQQVSVRAATTLAGRLVARFGTPIAAPLAPGLTHVFPSAREVAPLDVAAIGLPEARARALRALAGAVAAGRVRLDAGADARDVVTTLRAIPGIGAWTAEYIAMRVLGDPDAFPAGDLGVRRALGNGHGPVTPEVAERRSEAWRPWRAYAVMHLWIGRG